MLAANVRVIVQPTVEPVSLAEAKTHLRVDHDDEDTHIDGLLLAARIHCEKVARRAFTTRTLRATVDGWPADGVIELAYPPLQSISSVEIRRADGTTEVVNPVDYVVDTDSEPGRLFPALGASWPSATLRQLAGLAIEYVAGYGTAADVPQTYKMAILLLVGHWFENREAVVAGATAASLEDALNALLFADRGSF